MNIQKNTLALFFETLCIYTVYEGMNRTSGERDWASARRVALAKSKKHDTAKGSLSSPGFSLLR
jgi:hypothetical protein